MIASNELRKGNYVRLIGDEETVGAVLDIYGHFGVALQGNAVNNTSEQIEGIPIAPDILEKAGFYRKEEYNKTWILTLSAPDDNYPTTLQIWPREVGNYMQICRSGIAGWTIKNLEYLHQLQNLFFALTGTELTINL